MKRAIGEDKPDGWGLLLLPLCCLLPLLLLSLGSWIASTSIEFSAPVVIGGAVVVAGLILWAMRRRRRANSTTPQAETDKCCD